MKTHKVVIDRDRCFGCGYCIEFCFQGCFQNNKDTLNPRGLYIPSVVNPEKCNACGICVQMCPHWAVQVQVNSENESNNRLTGPPKLAQEPPFSGCAGCQHPTVGRIIAEVVDELGYGEKTIAIDGIPCSISSAFGTDFGVKIAHDENVLDVATVAKSDSTSSLVIAVPGYWGQADFSFNMGSFMNTLIRGDRYTIVLCNTVFYGPKDQRPAPVNEPVTGQLEPLTSINTPQGEKLIRGGYPLHLAELAATFPGVAYSARSTVCSVKDYHKTKDYIKTACLKQIQGTGLSFVEVLCICCDPVYSAPIECLHWLKNKMSFEFPAGEFRNVL